MSGEINPLKEYSQGNQDPAIYEGGGVKAP